MSLKLVGFLFFVAIFEGCLGDKLPDSFKAYSGGPINLHKVQKFFNYTDKLAKDFVSEITGQKEPYIRGLLGDDYDTDIKTDLTPPKKREAPKVSEQHDTSEGSSSSESHSHDEDYLKELVGHQEGGMSGVPVSVSVPLSDPNVPLPWPNEPQRVGYGGCGYTPTSNYGYAQPPPQQYYPYYQQYQQYYPQYYPPQPSYGGYGSYGGGCGYNRGYGGYGNNGYNMFGMPNLFGSNLYVGKK